MKYRAIIEIVDEKNNVITSMVKEEQRQFEMPKNNVIIHEFFIGALSIPQGREWCQFIEEMKGENNA